MAGKSLSRGSDRPLCKGIKRTLDFTENSRMLEVPEMWDVCQGELYAHSEQNQVEDAAVSKAGRKSCLRPLTSDMALQDSEVDLLGFSLLCHLSSLEKVTYILCHSMLEVYN